MKDNKQKEIKEEYNKGNAYYKEVEKSKDKKSK